MQFTIQSRVAAREVVEHRDGINSALECVREFIAQGRPDVKIVNEYGERVRPVVSGDRQPRIWTQTDGRA